MLDFIGMVLDIEIDMLFMLVELGEVEAVNEIINNRINE
jgi:hypothetical protein